jgi:hypothetical protein
MRLFGRFNDLKPVELFANAEEGLITIDCRLRGEQGIEQSRLTGTETNMAVLCRTHAGYDAKSMQPLFRQQSVGAVIQCHHRFSAFESL